MTRRCRGVTYPESYVINFTTYTKNDKCTQCAEIKHSQHLNLSLLSFPPDTPSEPFLSLARAHYLCFSLSLSLSIERLRERLLGA